jgi:helicase
MLEFFSKTFWAHQFKDIPKLTSKLNEMLEKLVEWDFIHIIDNLNTNNEKPNNNTNNQNEPKETINHKTTTTKSQTNKITSKFSDFVSAINITKKQKKTKSNNSNNNNNQNENKIFKATSMGKRVSGLYLDPLTANHLIDCLKNYQSQNNNQDIDSQTNNFQLLQMISNTLEIRPQLKVKTNDHELVQDAILKHHNTLLQKEPSQYDLEYHQFLNSIKTTLFFQDWICENTQDFLFEKFKIAPGEISVKLSIADWLFYACEEISFILKQKNTIKDIRKLRIRIKNGVKEELLELLKLTGVGRIRARKLYKNGIKNISDLKKTNQTAIGQIIGNKLAQDVKKQLGQEIIEIKPTKRKGQMSLNKFT